MARHASKLPKKTETAFLTFKSKKVLDRERKANALKRQQLIEKIKEDGDKKARMALMKEQEAAVRGEQAAIIYDYMKMLGMKKIVRMMINVSDNLKIEDWIARMENESIRNGEVVILKYSVSTGTMTAIFNLTDMTGQVSTGLTNIKGKTIGEIVSKVTARLKKKIVIIEDLEETIEDNDKLDQLALTKLTYQKMLDSVIPATGKAPSPAFSIDEDDTSFLDLSKFEGLVRQYKFLQAVELATGI